MRRASERVARRLISVRWTHNGLDTTREGAHLYKRSGDRLIIWEDHGTCKHCYRPEDNLLS